RLLRRLLLGLLEQRPAAASAAAAWRPGRRLGLGDVVAARRLGVDHHAAALAGRTLPGGSACTVPAPGSARAVSTGALRWSIGLGLRCGLRLRGGLLAIGLRRPLCGSGLLGLGLPLGGGSRRRAAPRALPRRERVGLLDARLRSLRLDAGGLERGKQLLAGHALCLGDLVYALLGHLATRSSAPRLRSRSPAAHRPQALLHPPRPRPPRLDRSRPRSRARGPAPGLPPRPLLRRARQRAHPPPRPPARRPRL